MATKKPVYNNESITALKGADRVRKRPGVMLGSDGLEGCQHTIFEILSNSVEHHGAQMGLPCAWHSAHLQLGYLLGYALPLTPEPPAARFLWHLILDPGLNCGLKTTSTG